MGTIEVRGLTKRYGPVLAVDRLSFSAGSGMVTGFLGPNGAGKTTTLRMLLGLVRPDAGTATINGMAYRDLPEPLHQAGAVLDAPGFHPGRTARDHLRIQALAGQADPSRIDDVLDLVGLSDAADRRAGGFSLGMRQRFPHHGAQRHHLASTQVPHEKAHRTRETWECQPKQPRPS
jgi:ABC-2 type transport system ATP-binding protein